MLVGGCQSSSLDEAAGALADELGIITDGEPELIAPGPLFFLRLGVLSRVEEAIRLLEELLEAAFWLGEPWGTWVAALVAARMFFDGFVGSWLWKMSTILRLLAPPLVDRVALLEARLPRWGVLGAVDR